VRVSIDVLATRDADDSSFLIDTGATHHLVADRSLLKDLVHLEVPLRFGLANTNTKIESTEKGTLSIGLSIGQSISVKDVYYVPAARMSISSASLCTEGWTIDLATRTISKGDVKLDLVNKGVLPYVKLARRIQNVSLVSTPLGVASAVQAESPLALEHRRLGHLGIKPLLDLAAAGELRYDNETLKSDVFTLSDCESCQRQKATRTSKGGTSPRGSEDGELVHTDTAGPFLPSPTGSEYYLALVADWSAIRMAYPLHSKPEALLHLHAFVNRLDRQLPVKVKYIRSDQGGEFTSGAALQWYLRLGLVHQTSPRYTPELNGVVECFNRTVKEMSGAMADRTPLSRY